MKGAKICKVCYTSLMRKYIQKILITFVLLTIVLTPDVLYAATTDSPTFSTNIYSSVHSILTMLYSVVVMLMFYALKLLQAFMDPKFTLAIMNGSSNPLLTVWQISRDLVNLFFGILLVTVALYTVFKADTTKAKEYAGKFVLAVVLVNFSWFGPRVVLDFANILTASIYNIPAMADSGGCVQADNTSPCVTIKEIIPYSASEAKALSTMTLAPTPSQSAQISCFQNRADTSPSAGEYIVINDSVCVLLEPYSLSSETGMLEGFLANFTLILRAGQLPTNGPNSNVTNESPFAINEYMDFTIKIMLNFVLILALAFPIMAMMVIFFVRTFILWITIAFMPFAFIGFLIGDKLGDNNPMQIWHEFWKNALLPAVLAVPIVVGMIMILAMIRLDCDFGPGASAALTTLCAKQSLPIIGMESWFHFIWYMMAIGVIYYGFFTATKFSKISEQIGGFFKAVGDQVLRAPLMLPIIPAGLSPNNNSTTVGEALRMASPSGIRSAIDSKVFNNNNTTNDPTINTLKNNQELQKNIKEGMEKGLAGLKTVITAHNTANPSQKIVIDSNNVDAIANQAGIERTSPAFQEILREIKANGPIK